MELSLQDHGTHEGIYNVHGLPGNEYPGIPTADVDERHLSGHPLRGNRLQAQVFRGHDT